MLFDLMSKCFCCIFVVVDSAAGRTRFSGGLNVNVSWSQELSLLFSKQSCDMVGFQSKSS